MYLLVTHYYGEGGGGYERGEVVAGEMGRDRF